MDSKLKISENSADVKENKRFQEILLSNKKRDYQHLDDESSPRPSVAIVTLSSQPSDKVLAFEDHQ